MSWQDPETARYSYFVTGGERDGIRAADVDRDYVAERLGTAYGEGRLSKDEYDARLDEALRARTYGELDRLVGDLPPAMQPSPGGPVAPPDNPIATVNRLAIASIICGLAQFLVVPLAIPAILLGHKARSQIKRTGEQGAGLALAGLVLGWLVLIVLAVSLAVGLTAAAGTHGWIPPHPAH
jgi:hypothetical protein